ncbi:MAG: hypothetical protein ACE5FD_18965 [Anaerolineae bacterium]
MQNISNRWSTRAYHLIIAGAGLFVLLTIIAMFFYPGGVVGDPSTHGYIFTRNFFSDLGLTVAHNGQANTTDMVLFTTSLTVVGAGLVFFFLMVPRLFWNSTSGKILSILGSAAGIVTAISYIGVGWTPADIRLEAHVNFVFTAFEAFPIAALLYAIAIYRQPGYPRRFAVVYLVFTLLLGAYLWLLFFGPNSDSAQGLVIQVVGQKLIVYAAVIAMSIQGIGALQVEKNL